MADRICSTCHKAKSLSEFGRDYIDRMGWHRRRARCVRCTTAFTFGLSIGQYDEMWDAQKGLCGLCGNPETAKSKFGKTLSLAVDHDHACCADYRKTCGQCFRGLLCQSCNLRLNGMEHVWELLAETYRAAA